VNFQRFTDRSCSHHWGLARKRGSASYQCTLW
jgi:hypothetical protein